MELDFTENKWLEPKPSRCILWTWPDFFIVHFMEYNRDVDVGKQDINRPSWHLTKKKIFLSEKGEFFNSWYVVGRRPMQIVWNH